MMFNNAKEEVILILNKKINIMDVHIRNALSEELENDRKLSSNQFGKIINGLIDLENLDIVILCVLYRYFKKYFTSMEDTEKYFTTIEINQSKDIIVETGDLKYPIVFTDATLLNDNHWQIKMPIQLIGALKSSKLLTKNKDCQRETIIKKYGDITVEYINFFPKSISEIESELLKGNYIPDEMSFNLIADGEEDFEYDEQSHTLTIKSGRIDLTDGNNRTIAIANALDKDPNLDYNFPIAFTHFPLWKAQKTIEQREKKNAIIETVSKSYAANSQNNIVNDIISHRDLSEYLKNKILKTQANVNVSGIFLFDDLSRSIKCFYEQTDLNRYKKKTTDWIVEFLNEITYIFEDEFKNINKTKKETWIMSNSALYLYIYLSNELKNVPNWNRKLEEILLKIDFKKENEQNLISSIDSNIIKKVKEFINNIKKESE